MTGGKQSRLSSSALVVAAFMTGFWLLGIGGLMIGSGLSTDDGGTAYRNHSTGTTYAYQDATGKFTVYLRGSRRTSYAEPYEIEG